MEGKGRKWKREEGERQQKGRGNRDRKQSGSGRGRGWGKEKRKEGRKKKITGKKITQGNKTTNPGKKILIPYNNKKKTNKIPKQHTSTPTHTHTHTHIHTHTHNRGVLTIQRPCTASPPKSRSREAPQCVHVSACGRSLPRASGLWEEEGRRRRC